MKTSGGPFGGWLWTIPAARIKGNVLHRAPLGPTAFDILERQLDKSETCGGLVLPSRSRKPMTDMVLTKYLRDKKILSDTPAASPPLTASAPVFTTRHQHPRADIPRYCGTGASAYDQECGGGNVSSEGLLEQRRAMMLEWERYCLQDG
ncbi:hypothetical protein [Rhizobium wenxiniae]|uniref:hypothetical protein n=1 Tax=Rhizobium wenxiniae TaxID=1737357 RepID=UPI001C6F24C6|nr:hypothetical protein [Rhizobium wenxiniae]